MKRALFASSSAIHAPSSRDYLFPPFRLRAEARATFIGIAAGVIPLFGAFAILGILDDFFRGTFIEVLGVGPAYTLGFFVPPEVLSAKRFFPEVLAVLLERRAFE